MYDQLERRDAINRRSDEECLKISSRNGDLIRGMYITGGAHVRVQKSFLHEHHPVTSPGRACENTP